jgi:Lrp/AsnC family transcriptional regulator, leucine-responsive regulatory protein
MRVPDEIDLQIMRLLQSDGRMTNAELAKRVELSPPSTLNRVRVLEQTGYIRGYHGVIDSEKLGLKLTVLCHVSLSLHQDQAIDRFVKRVQEIPEIVECYHTSGTADFLLKIVARDMRHYEQLVREQLSRIRGVGQINSSFVLAKHKQSSGVPV